MGTKKGVIKLRTYNTLKKEFIYGQYLEMQHKFDLRKNITKLSISSHRLEIETGRYKNIAVKDRICKIVILTKLRMKNIY